MAITQNTTIITVKSITQQVVNGITCNVVNFRAANDVGTDKNNLFGGLPTKTGLPVAGTLGTTHGCFTMVPGQGTLPAVGDTINVVAG